MVTHGLIQHSNFSDVSVEVLQESGERRNKRALRSSRSTVRDYSIIFNSAANSEVEKCGHLEAASGKKRSHYAKFTPEQKAEVGCRAAEHGVASTIPHYASQFTLKETTIRGWRDSYIKEIKWRIYL